MSKTPPPVEELDELPPRLRALVAQLPEYMDDTHSAQVIREHCFAVSDRTLETWLLPTRYINGRAQHPTVAVLLEAWRRISTAPEVMRGRPIGRGIGRRRAGDRHGGPAPPEAA